MAGGEATQLTAVRAWRRVDGVLFLIGDKYLRGRWRGRRPQIFLGREHDVLETLRDVVARQLALACLHALVEGAA